MVHIIEEGLRERARRGVTGWICASCWHHMTYTREGVCANCHTAGALYPVQTLDKIRDEKERRLADQRFKPLDGTKNPHSLEAQMGSPLTSTQVLALLPSSVVAIPSWNQWLGRHLLGLYIPFRGHELKKLSLTEFQQSRRLEFVCAMEDGVMPEWDVIPTDADGLPDTQIRGWRSVLGIFYRQGIIPFLPDAGHRESYWQIKQSPLKR